MVCILHIRDLRRLAAVRFPCTQKRELDPLQDLFLFFGVNVTKDIRLEDLLLSYANVMLCYSYVLAPIYVLRIPRLKFR